MSKFQNQRRKLYRQAASAYHHLDLAMEDIMTLREIFAPDHPTLAGGLDIAMQNALMAQQIILTFAWVAWRKDREMLLTYLGN